MGKWSHLKQQDGIVRQVGAQDGGSERRARVDKLKALLQQLGTTEILEKMVDVKANKEKLEEQIKSINEGLDAVNEVLVARWEDEGIDKISAGQLGTFSLIDTPYWHVV